jgi:excisionase family DNA binding protein
MKQLSQSVVATANPDKNSELMTPEQVCDLLQILPRTLVLWRHTRGLPFVKITSKFIRYRRKDIDAWLEARRTVIA